MKSIAREVALEFSKSEIMPMICQHIPGVTNTIADRLSRKYEPNAQFVLPAALVSAHEAIVPVRDAAYYIVPFRASRGKKGR